jgi:hypothetical protein
MKNRDSEKLKQQMSLIDHFLADNPELEELTALLSQFNIFRALKIEKLEMYWFSRNWTKCLSG